MASRFLVTGGAGFIGAQTVARLLCEEKQVVVLDNLSSGCWENLPTHPNLECIEGDVLDYVLLSKLISTCDAVLHLAAIASVPASLKNPIETFRVNTQGLLHVLQAIHQTGRPVRLVYASSAAVYGEVTALPCCDEAALACSPLSPYALQKIENENYADLYARLYGISSLGLRYFNVYGLGQDPSSPYSGVISRFVDAYQKGEALTILGDGKQSRDFIHVSEVAKANVLALASDQTGVLNIGTGEAETLLDLVRYLEAAGGQPAMVCFGEQRVGDIVASYAAISRAASRLGFRSEISLREGIRDLVSSLA